MVFFKSIIVKDSSHRLRLPLAVADPESSASEPNSENAATSRGLTSHRSGIHKAKLNLRIRLEGYCTNTFTKIMQQLEEEEKKPTNEKYINKQ